MRICRVNIHHGEQSRDNRRDACDYGCHIGELLAGASHVSYLGILATRYLDRVAGLEGTLGPKGARQRLIDRK